MLNAVRIPVNLNRICCAAQLGKFYAQHNPAAINILHEIVISKFPCFIVEIILVGRLSQQLNQLRPVLFNVVPLSSTQPVTALMDDTAPE